MRVTCHHCNAVNAVEESALEEGGLNRECVECAAMMYIDGSGRVFATERALLAYQDRGTAAEDFPSDAFATIPLPSLGELGLKPPPRTKQPSHSSGPPPPRAGSIADVDLDQDEEPETKSPAPTAQSSTAQPSTLPPSSQLTSKAIPRYTVSVPVPPVTRYGWLVFAGLTLLGLLTGAVFFGGPDEGAAAFDETAGRAAFREASRTAVECFDGTLPGSSGVLSVQFSPNGDASQVTVEGDLAKSDRLECIRESYAQAEVPAFRGPPVILRQRLALGSPR